MSISGEYKKRDFKSAKDWHVYHVYNDPEFINDFNKLDIEKDDTKDIRKKYAITGYDLFFFDIRNILYLEKNVESKGGLTFDPRIKKYVLTFDATITKSEFLECWKEFADFRDDFIGKPNSKRKPPVNDTLIYAIFKARKKLTFAEIFELYSVGRLPLYKGSSDQFKSEDSLERYYDKYKPGK
jgi:hypothetical protein